MLLSMAGKIHWKFIRRNSGSGIPIKMIQKNDTISGMTRELSSIHNPLIKKIIQLREKSRERRKKGLFIIEGRREIELAIKGGYEIRSLLYNPDIISEEYLNSLKKNKQTEIISITVEAY